MAGIVSGWGLTGERAGLDGSLGGSDGRDAGSGCGRGTELVLDGSAGGDLAASAAASSFALASSSRFVGGSGGRLAWSKAGGSFRAAAPSAAELTLVAAEFSERAESVEICEISDAVDLRRTSRS